MNARRRLKRRMAVSRERAVFPIMMKNVFDKIIAKFSRSFEQILDEHISSCFASERYKCDQKITRK